MGKALLETLAGKVVTPKPLWVMRQAGRYLPEYQATRAKAGSFMKLALTPDYAAEVTLQPIRRFGFDAAILFSDILMVPYGLGRALEFKEGEGPVLNPYVPHELSQLVWQPERVAMVYEAIKLVKADLNDRTALIGFVGSPFTVACYMVDGKGGGFPRTREMAAKEPLAFTALIEAVTEATITHLLAQIKAGAEVVQLFDSWANLVVDPVQFEHWVIRPTAKIVAAVKAAYPQVPVIGFPREVGPGLLVKYSEATKVDALSIGHGTDMEWALAHLKPVLQGNLAPEALIEGGVRLEQAVKRLLKMTEGRAHIINLGHGIEKETPIEHVMRLVELVRMS